MRTHSSKKTYIRQFLSLLRLWLERKDLRRQKTQVVWNFEVFLLPWAIFYPVSRIPTHVSDQAGHINWKKSLKNLAELYFLLSEPFISFAFISGQFHDVWKKTLVLQALKVLYSDSMAHACSLQPYGSDI